MLQSPGIDGRPRSDVPILLVIALACLIAGLTLPIMEVRQFWVFRGTYSILDGIRLLLRQGEILVALVVIAFSIVMPAAKIIALLAFWWRLRQGGTVSSRWPAHLEGLSKWSMLDVFVVALIVFAAKASAVADAAVSPAVVPFVASIVLTAWCGRSLRKTLTAGRNTNRAVRP
jgi:paraquat-inducible protein A